MPDPGSKKRPTQQTGSGKLSKRGNSLENVPAMDALILQDPADAENEENNENKEPELALPTPEPVKDIMRTEPILSSVFIESYEGEYDDKGFYHGVGNARLKDGMVYTGMFKHGKMNEHGVLEWPNGNTFSGDFVENVISGKGSYCWPDGSTYEGEVLNGLRHGDGTFNCVDSKTYSGQWENGKRHGKGILYYDESGLSYYNGDWVANEKCGYGVRRFPNGNMYEGHWKDNIRNGQGTMYWFNNGQEYSGTWVNGVQNGHGEYSWYLKRVGNSQYPLRNKYIGNFLNGERHGHGAFHYASGAMYDGEWHHDMKHGNGKFTFKNGSVFVGQFVDDHMVDFPELILPRMVTPDIESSGIPVTSAMSQRSKSSMGVTRNIIVDAFLDIDLDEIFCDYKYDLEQRQEEVQNIMRSILRNTTKLKNIYKIYSCLGSGASADNTFVMFKCQFLRFLKDYNVHRLGYTLSEIERYLEEEGITLQNCFKKLFIRDFLNHLVKISYLLFKDEVEDDEHIFSCCFSKLVSFIVNRRDSSIKGYIYKSIKHVEEVHKFINKIFEIYFYFAGWYYPSHDVTLRLRDIIYIFKDMKLINEDFDCTELVNILTREEKDEEGYYNLDKEITPFEFLEAIVGSSSVFISDKIIEIHRPTHIVPILSLNTLKNEESATFMFKNEDESKNDDSINAQSAEQFLPEDISSKDSNADCTTISPVKSAKSSSRAHRKSAVGKKVEKESSGTNISKAKKDGSKMSRKSSSNKMDETKQRSPNTRNIESSEADVNQENTVSADKSHDSTVEPIPSLMEDVLPPSETELAVESSIEIEIAKKATVEEEQKAKPEDKEGFDLWSLRFNLFLKEYFFPKFENMKMLNEVIRSQKECVPGNTELLSD